MNEYYRLSFAVEPVERVKFRKDVSTKKCQDRDILTGKGSVVGSERYPTVHIDSKSEYLPQNMILRLSLVSDQTTSYEDIQDNVHYNKLLQCRKTNKSDWNITKEVGTERDISFSGISIVKVTRREQKDELKKALISRAEDSPDRCTPWELNQLTHQAEVSSRQISDAVIKLLFELLIVNQDGSKQCVAWILTDVIKDLTSEDGSIQVSMISLYSASVSGGDRLMCFLSGQEMRFPLNSFDLFADFFEVDDEDMIVWTSSIQINSSLLHKVGQTVAGFHCQVPKYDRSVRGKVEEISEETNNTYFTVKKVARKGKVVTAQSHRLKFTYTPLETSRLKRKAQRERIYDPKSPRLDVMPSNQSWRPPATSAQPWRHAPPSPAQSTSSTTPFSPRTPWTPGPLTPNPGPSATVQQADLMAPEESDALDAWVTNLILNTPTQAANLILNTPINASDMASLPSIQVSEAHLDLQQTQSNSLPDIQEIPVNDIQVINTVTASPGISHGNPDHQASSSVFSFGNPHQSSRNSPSIRSQSDSSSRTSPGLKVHLYPRPTQTQPGENTGGAGSSVQSLDQPFSTDLLQGLTPRSEVHLTPCPQDHLTPQYQDQLRPSPRPQDLLRSSPQPQVHLSTSPRPQDNFRTASPYSHDPLILNDPMFSPDPMNQNAYNGDLRTGPFWSSPHNGYNMEDIVLDGIQIQVDSANKSDHKNDIKTKSADKKSIKIESSDSLSYKQIIKIESRESSSVSHVKLESAKSSTSKEKSAKHKVEKEKLADKSEQNDMIKVELSEPSDDIINVESICDLTEDMKSIKLDSLQVSKKNQVNIKNGNATLEAITQKVHKLSVKK